MCFLKMLAVKVIGQVEIISWKNRAKISREIDILNEDENWALSAQRKQLQWDLRWNKQRYITKYPGRGKMSQREDGENRDLRGK
jgi:hypothetical protein